MDRDRTLALPTGRQKVRVGFDPSEPMLIPHRISVEFQPPNGADISFVAVCSGRSIFCKDDKDGRRIRALEMLSTRIAGEVGILTPECAVVENDHGHTFFGSFGAVHGAADFEVQNYLTTQELNEFGGPEPWLKRYVSGLYAFDLFIGNPDRNKRNFVMALDDRHLRAMDFASGDLKIWAAERISIENTNTLSLGRMLRKIHGFDVSAALEIAKRIEGIPVNAIRRFLAELPADWLNEMEGESLCEGWEHKLGARLAALSAGLRDGSLL